MKIEVKNLPVFASEAAKLATLRADDLFGVLTVEEVEKLQKLWLYEVLMELRQPPESKMLFYTRTTASKELGIAPQTLDELIKKSAVSWKWLGNRRILLQSDLNSLIKTENIYQNGKDHS